MLSDQIESLVNNHKKISLAEIIKVIGNSSFGFLVSIIALPSALPVPAPGYSVPFGILMIILALQIIWGRSAPWIPQCIKHKTFNLDSYKHKTHNIIKFITFFEKFIHPRWNIVFIQKSRLLGIILLICGGLMCLPIPGTNTIPAIGAFVIGLSIIERDGLMASLGAGLAGVGLAFSLIIIYLGKNALQLIF